MKAALCIAYDFITVFPPVALLLSLRPLKMEKFYVIVWWMAVKMVLSYSASCAGFAFSHWDVVCGVTSVLFLTY